MRVSLAATPLVALALLTTPTPSAESAQARRLFDAERWSDAALALKRVVDGDTGDGDPTRQVAQYDLAICLYRLRFSQASSHAQAVRADQEGARGRTRALPRRGQRAQVLRVRP